MRLRTADEAKAREATFARTSPSRGRERAAVRFILPASVRAILRRMHFFRFRVEHALEGLIRRRTTEAGGTEFAYLTPDGFVLNQSLRRHFLDPGDVDLVEVTAKEAEAVARASGVEIDADVVGIETEVEA